MPEGADAREQRWTLRRETVTHTESGKSLPITIAYGPAPDGEVEVVLAARLAEVERERDQLRIDRDGCQSQLDEALRCWEDDERRLERAREALTEIRDRSRGDLVGARAEIDAIASVALVAIGPATRGGDGDGA